jgi:DNA-binding CsgD family transcriptional regulator
MGRPAGVVSVPRDGFRDTRRALVCPSSTADGAGDGDPVVVCIVDVLTSSTEPGMLLTAAGVVHWANDAFWLVEGIDRVRGPSALLSALGSDDRAVLTGTLLKMRDDGGPRRIQVGFGRRADAPVQLALTALPTRPQLIAARVVECAGARERIGRARAMESALLQIRDELRVLGHDWAGDHAIGATEEPPAVPLPPDLPARQRDVALLILEGFAVKDIASKLDLSLHTVRNHLKVVFRRTGVHSRAAFVARYHA